MSIEKKSQIVIPINAQTLFTTLFGAAVIASVTFILVTIPGKITEIRDAQIRIEQKQNSFSDFATAVSTSVKKNADDIVDLKVSKFSEDDATRLAKSITADIQTMLAPCMADVLSFKKDVERIDRELRALNKRDGEKTHD